MRPLSQVDPWNGCRVCRTLAERGILPDHNWTHELRMWWDDKVPVWTRGSEPGREIPEPEPSAVGTAGTVVGVAGVALAPLVAEAFGESFREVWELAATGRRGSLEELCLGALGKETRRLAGVLSRQIRDGGEAYDAR